MTSLLLRGHTVLPGPLNMSANVQLKTNYVKAVLKEAKLYQGNNSLQRRDATEVLEEYSSSIKWKKGARVLDVGCGDGGVTAHVLKPYLPASFERLVGCDIAPEMILHANLNHKSERVNFEVMDVSSSRMESLGQFDHVFSFYALHWVQEQEKAISNIYSALAPGGDCLLVFLGHIPVYDIYRILAEQPQWKEYMYDLNKYISPYHDSEHPEEEFRRVLEKAGFTDVAVQCKNKIYTYEGIDNLKKAIRAVNPFNHRLSPALREQFLDEYFEIVRSKKFVTEETASGDNRAIITTYYKLIIARATK